MNKDNKYDCKEFDDMTFLSDELFKGIHAYGYTHPSQIQVKTIAAINAGIDVIAQSQSGTGKTGAFGIGALSTIKNIPNPQIIIMSNTKELSSQIYVVISELAAFMNIKICLCIGGVDIKNNKRDVRNSHILIGTPGRLNDLIQNKYFNVNNVNMFIIDEADALLNNDFIEQTQKIVTSLPEKTQMCLYSATFSQDNLAIINQFVKPNPYHISVAKEHISLELIKQYIINLDNNKDKFMTLIDLYQRLTITKVIIFVNYIKHAEYLINNLEKEGIENVPILHGKMDFIERENILKNFRLGYYRILVTTDILARGIDIKNINLVINYDFPEDLHQYIHRVGRTGRFGKFGVAINFISSSRDKTNLKIIEKHFNIKLDDMPNTNVVNKILSNI